MTTAAKKETTEVALEERAPQERHLVKPEPGAIGLGERGLQLTTLDEVWQLAAIMHASHIGPKEDSKEDVFGKLAYGFELGISPMMALNCIYIVNNRTAIFGDAVPGLVERSRLLEWDKVDVIGAYPNDDFGFVVTSKRMDREPKSWTYTIADAKRAKLWGKPGAWTTDSKRMLFYRCRTFNYRDNFPDVLKGLHTVEEMRDIVNAEYEVQDDRTQTERLVDIVVQKPPKPEPPETPQEAETEDMFEDMPPDESGDLFDNGKTPESPDDRRPFPE